MLKLSFARQTWLPFLEDDSLSSDERRQQIFVAIATLLATPAMFLFAIIEWFMNEPLMVNLLVAAGLMMGSAYWLTRRSLYSPWIPRVLVAYVCLMILVQVLLDRGQYTLFLPFLIPIISVYIFGLAEGITWSMLAFLVLGILTAFPQAFGLTTLDGALLDFVTTYLALVAFSAGYEMLRARADERASIETAKLRLEQQRLLEVQKQLQASEHKFRTYAELASDWLFELDTTYRITYLSPNFRNTFGSRGDVFLNANVLELMRANSRSDIEESLALLLEHQPFRDFPLKITTPEGDIRYALVRGEPMFDETGRFTGYLGSGTDTTSEELARRELRQKERALHHAQKMEALGQLTSGVAHDFNNLLTVIVGNLEMLKLDYPDEDASDKIRAAEIAVSKAADLTAQLLSFARRQPLSPSALDLNNLLGGMEDMLRRTLGARIELKFFQDAELWSCEADASQLESAILNLALNARDAISDSGTLTISARNTVVGSEPAPGPETFPLELVPGEYVEVTVADDGAGIPAEMLDRIIEPFFTTKPSGEGTGLGLSMVYGFVTQSGGNLRITSVPGMGTRVTFWLPRSTGRSNKVTVLKGSAQSEVGSLDVLIVEDEPAVQQVLLRMMEIMGHSVTIADNGEAAMQQINQRVPDLMISDIMLGRGINGVELADWVHHHYPGIAVMLITGYPKDALKDRNVSDFAPEIVTKPFSMSDLGAAIARIAPDKGQPETRGDNPLDGRPAGT
ncbi:MAG: ATP-binding protein [Pseudomonadota bacterium]